MRARTLRRLVSVLALSGVVAACGGGSSSPTTTAAGASSTGAAVTTTTAAKLSATLNSSGATFPKPFYEEAIAAFKKNQPDVTINYAGGGSGKGRQDLADNVVDFAGSDGVVKDED